MTKILIDKKIGTYKSGKNWELIEYSAINEKGDKITITAYANVDLQEGHRYEGELIQKFKEAPPRFKMESIIQEQPIYEKSGKGQEDFTEPQKEKTVEVYQGHKEYHEDYSAFTPQITSIPSGKEKPMDFVAGSSMEIRIKALELAVKKTHTYIEKPENEDIIKTAIRFYSYIVKGE